MMIWLPHMSPPAQPGHRVYSGEVQGEVCSVKCAGRRVQRPVLVELNNFVHFLIHLSDLFQTKDRPIVENPSNTMLVTRILDRKILLKVKINILQQKQIELEIQIFFHFGCLLRLWHLGEFKLMMERCLVFGIFVLFVTLRGGLSTAESSPITGTLSEIDRLLTLNKRAERGRGM